MLSKGPGFVASFLESTSKNRRLASQPPNPMKSLLLALVSVLLLGLGDSAEAGHRAADPAPERSAGVKKIKVKPRKVKVKTDKRSPLRIRKIEIFRGGFFRIR